MTGVTRTFGFVLLAICSAGVADAQTVPSSFKDMQFLVKAGDRVTVVDAAGARISGRISELDASTLSIESGSGPRRFAQDDVVLTLVKDGDHRLSRPEDIERLIAAVAEF